MTALLLLALAGAPAHAADWPFWGRTPSRNMVASEKVVPISFDPGKFVPGTETVDMATTKGVKWVAKLGSQTYGNPTVSDGRVFVGTNNALARRAGFTGDYSVALALSEADGSVLWQMTVPKLGSGKVNDWDWLGLTSSLAIVDDIAYVVTSRGEIAALDVNGLRNGNQGYQDESAYMSKGGLPAPELLPDVDADILWLFDMPEELGVFTHNASSNSTLIVGDRLYVATSNGVDWSHIDIPSPFAPALIALDRHTGALIGEEAVGISERLLHANWSSPLYVPKKGKSPATLVFGAGDAFMYGFDPVPGVDATGLHVLNERWRMDCNPPTYWKDEAGNPRKYTSYDGPSETIATPVFADGMVFFAIGQDPEHGPGVGRLQAVVPWAKGETKPVWTFDGIGRSISTVAVSDGLVYAADYEGRVYCVDEKTGVLQWKVDTKAHIWGSPMVAGDYVMIGDEDGVFHVLSTGRTLNEVAAISLSAPIYSTPVLANGVLYVATQTHLYAIDGK